MLVYKANKSNLLKGGLNMNEYQRLETKLISYLSREEVKKTANTISFYDLYKSLEEKFKALKDIQLNNGLINKINSDNAKNKRKKSQDFIIKELDSVLSTTENNTSKITFFYGTGYHPETFTILKDFDDDDIYYSSTTKPNEEFISHYYEDIISIFNTLEEYAKLTKGDIGINKENSNLQPMVFTDGFLTISIIYGNYGQINTDITISTKEDQNSLYKREWYTRKKLSDIVSENSDEILKKIPINIADLNTSCQEILSSTIVNH